MGQLGNRIRHLREVNNYSQKRVADAIGISNVQLSRYESGDRKPDPEIISLLADFFEVSTDYLLGRTDEIEKKSKVNVAGQEINLTSEEIKLFEELKKHPVMFHDLASNPEKKVKELIKLYKVKEMLIAEDEDEYGDGFGELED